MKKDSFIASSRQVLLSTWKKHQLKLLLICQLLLLCIAFPKVLFQPQTHMLCNYNDGMRQYFFYQSYLEQDAEKGWTKVYSMGYPYGEYMLFTDATPLLAISVKLFSHYIWDISEKGIPIFNYFILLGHLLSSFFLFRILKRMRVQEGLIFFFALCLPWLGIEFFKISQGHLNLSISWPLLGTIYFMQGLYLNRKIDAERRPNRLVIAYAFFLFLIAFIHLYGMAMSALLMGVFYLTQLIQDVRKQRGIKKTLAQAVLSLGLPLLLSLFIVRLSDGYFSDRLAHGEGYGWEHWVLQFEGLFSSHFHNSIPFIFEDSKLYSFGSFAYLGSFALYGFLFGLLAFVLLKKSRQALIEDVKTQETWRFFLLLVLGTFFSLMIALGEQIYIERLDLTIPNYLNLFYYVHLFTDRITQFRDVSRFSFIVFWTFNLIIIYLIQLHLKSGHFKTLSYAAISVLLLLCLIDTWDSLVFARKEMNRPHLLLTDADTDIYALGKQIDAHAYQAIIPIPYSHEGAGDNHYVIDAYDDFLSQSMQLQRLTKLPLMSAKFSRGNFEHAKQLLSMFDSQSHISEELLNHVSDKPILVLFHSDYYKEGEELQGNSLEPAWSILQNCHKIIDRYQMKELVREGPFVLYEWEMAVKKNSDLP